MTAPDQSIPADLPADPSAEEEASPLPPEPPAAPRLLTPRVRRRAWAEPRVRAVVLAAATALLVGGYLLASRYVLWRREAWLISDGTLVDATVTEAGGVTLANKVFPPASSVTLEYTVGANKHTVSGNLKGRKQYITTGGTVPIRVDPNHPETWTALTTPLPLRVELLGGFVVLPFAAVLGLAALVLQKRLLRLWRQGEATAVVVVDAGHTAIAPRTHRVRCAPLDPEDRRLLQAYVPAHQPRPERGEPLWLIASRPPSNRAAAVAWFE